jgi:hypothetical protein
MAVGQLIGSQEEGPFMQLVVIINIIVYFIYINNLNVCKIKITYHLKNIIVFRIIFHYEMFRVPQLS